MVLTRLIDKGRAVNQYARSALAPPPGDAESLRLRASGPERGSPLRRIARLLLSVHLATVLVVDLDDKTQPLRREDLTFHWVVDPSDPLVELTDNPELVRASLERGDGVNLITDGGVFVGRSTISFASFREPFMGVKVRLGEGEAWVGESYTVPEFRRRGVGAFRSAAMLANLASIGVTRVYASVEDWNAASRGMSAQSGFRHVQDFRFLRVFRHWGLPVPGSVKPRGAPLA